MEQLMGKTNTECNSGRENGATTYAAYEGWTQFFNLSENSLQWRTTHWRIVKVYYSSLGVLLRQSVALKNHFVELYSALNLGIRHTGVRIHEVP